jgi:polysaccharide deacetylase 2 family uncharacterized protein YibQ
LARKKAKNSGGRLKALAALLVVLIVAVVAFSRYLDTPKGRILLLDLGVDSRFAEVQQDLEAAIVGALEGAGIERRGIRFERDSGVARPVSHLRVVVAENRSLIKINAAIDGAVHAAGGRIRSCVEGKSGRSIMMELGTRQALTHTCLIRKGRAGKQSRSPQGTGPVIALLVDDFGYFNNRLVREFLELDVPLTISVIPGLKYSSRICKQALDAGKEVLCHLPMEPEDGADDVGEIPLVRVAMRDREIRRVVEKALGTTPGITGMNNHMGSKATADRRVMRTVLGICRERGLYFVDSMTTNRSVVREMAEREQVESLSNDLFIDNREEETRENMHKLISIAEHRGDVLGILHVRSESLGQLRWLVEQARRKGIRFVTVSQLIEMKHYAHVEGGRS